MPFDHPPRRNRSAESSLAEDARAGRFGGAGARHLESVILETMDSVIAFAHHSNAAGSILNRSNTTAHSSSFGRCRTMCNRLSPKFSLRSLIRARFAVACSAESEYAFCANRHALISLCSLRSKCAEPHAAPEKTLTPMPQSHPGCVEKQNFPLRNEKSR